MKTKAFFSLLGAALISQAFVPGEAAAQALNYQNYNVIVFGDLSTNSDVEGRTFVGGNLTGQNSSNFGIHLKPTITPDDRSLVVGGNVGNGNPIQLQRGSLYVGGSVNRIVNYNGGGSRVTDTSIASQLATIRDYSIAQSAALQSMTADSYVTLPGSQPSPTNFYATGGADGVAVFNVSGADIFSNSRAQQIGLIADAATTSVVINVSGTTINWTDGNMVGAFNQDYWQGHVMWNFYEATSINLGGRNFNGAILAPNATVTASGVIDGLVVAKNLTTTSEVHLPNSNSATPYAFDGYTAPVPEPGSLIFLVAAAGVVLVARNRRLFN